MFFQSPQILKKIPELADSCTPPEELPRHIKRFLPGPSNFGTPIGPSQLKLWSYGKQGSGHGAAPLGDPIGLGGFWKNSFKLPYLSLQIWAFDWMACSLGRHWPARRDFHTNEAVLGVFQMVQPWTWTSKKNIANRTRCTMNHKYSKHAANCEVWISIIRWFQSCI